MAREHFWKDRAQVMRVAKKIVRGEVQPETAVAVGAEIACLLTNISGREAPADARTYLPENALLQLSVKDTEGADVSVRQGDTLLVTYSGGSRGKFKIVGDIRPNRRGQQIVSYTLEVKKDTEH